MTRASEGKPRRSVLAPKPKRLDNSKTRSEFVKEHPFKIELLKSLVFLEKSSNALPELVRHDNKQLGSLYTSYTKDVRDAIKSNGDRVSDSINELRYIVNEMMTSQNEMDKTLIKSLQVITSTLQYVLSTISRIEGKAFGPRPRRPATHVYTKADKGRKATPRRQNNGRHTNMVIRKRHQYQKLSGFSKSDKGRKVTPRRLNNDRQTRMPIRKHHQHHKLSGFKKAYTGTGRKAISRQQKNKIVRTINRLQNMLSVNSQATTKAKLKDQPVQRARDGLRKKKYDVEDDSDIPDSGSKELKGHKRRDYADLITLLHLYNPDNFVNTWMTDIE